MQSCVYGMLGFIPLFTTDPISVSIFTWLQVYPLFTLTFNFSLSLFQVVRLFTVSIFTWLQVFNNSSPSQLTSYLCPFSCHYHWFWIKALKNIIFRTVSNKTNLFLNGCPSPRMHSSTKLNMLGNLLTVLSPSSLWSPSSSRSSWSPCSRLAHLDNDILQREDTPPPPQLCSCTVLLL